MEQNNNEARPFVFYFLMVFLTCGTSFIGYNFGHIIGALIGFTFAVVVNVYALQIKHD